MGKIIKLKNKKTGEHVYPVSVTKAIADPDSGERLNDILLNKVEEAPIDGEQYARINGVWAKVEGGGDENALITLLPNSSELYGASVKVTTNSGETLLDTTWQGAALSVQIPSGVEYTVIVGNVNGFVAPSAKTFTATKGATRSISMTYIPSTLKVNILSNQSNDSILSSVKATVKYGSTTLQVSNGQIVSLPQNVDVTITFPAVANYKSPDTITFKHTEGNIEKSGTYQTELVKVSLSANNGVSVNGQVVTINGNSHTWNGSVIEQKIAFGVNYSVSVNDMNGFTSPTVKSFTAGQSVREVSLIYEEIPRGIFIQGVSGKLYKEEQWNNQEEANGIAVMVDECQFVMALKHAGTDNYKWSENNTLVNGITTTTDESDASDDYNGKSNTTTILNSLGNSETSAAAAYRCNTFRFPNMQYGYLGSAGEWTAVVNNYDAIESALAKCGGVGLYNKYYWTSTQIDSMNAWGVLFTLFKLTSRSKTVDGCPVRAFLPI